jgi:hypothetical protein
VRAVEDEGVRQSVDDVGELGLALDADHLRLMGELVEYIQCAEYSVIAGPVLNEILEPDIVGLFRPQTEYERSFSQNQPFETAERFLTCTNFTSIRIRRRHLSTSPERPISLGV